TSGGSINADSIDAGLLGDVFLTASGAINAAVNADNLVSQSTGSTTLSTTVTSLDTTITGTGDLAVAEADDIILTNLDMANGSISVTAAGNILDGTISAPDNAITLTSDGDITASQITAATLNAQASGDITLTTTVDNLDITAGVTGTVNWTSTGILSASATINGSVLDAVTDGDLTLNTSAETLKIDAGSTGNVVLIPSGVAQLTAEITALTLDMSADSDVTLTTTASITTIDVGSSNDASIGLTRDGPATVNATAASLSATALNSLTLNTTIDNLSAQVTGIGAVSINETDGLSIRTVSTTNGSIEITTGGNLAATKIQSLTDSDTNDITIISGGSITAAMIDAGNLGDVCLTASGNINATITADELSIQAAGSAIVSTTVSSADVVTTQPGTIQITETDEIVLNAIQTANGSIEITAAGDILATQVQSLLDLEANDITITTTNDGSIDVSTIDAGTQGDVLLTSAGAVDVNNLTANSLSATSQDSMNLSTTVDELTLQVTGSGNLTINEADALTINSAKIFNGAIIITTGNDITATHIQSLTSADSNDLSITSGGSISVDVIDAGFLGDVFLTASGAINAAVKADNLVSLSNGFATLSTTLTSLDTTITGTGDLTVVEADDITLTNLDMANGSVSVTAAGSILDGTITAAGNTVTLTSGGNIHASQITAATLNAQASGDITLTTTVDNLDITAGVTGTVNWTSTGILSASANVNGSVLNAVTDGDLTLNTSVETLEVDAGSTGNVVLTSSGVSQVTADITGLTLDMTAESDVNLTTTASETTINVGTINDVSIELTRDGPATVNATAAGLSATAINDLTLNTTVDSLSAQVTGTGTISINETNSLLVNTVSTANGSIEISTGGNLTATQIQSLTDSDTNDITITSGGSITADLIDAGTLGDVLLTASGDIHATIIADELSIQAAGSSILSTTVSSADVVTTQPGTIQITESDSIILNNVQTANGSIEIAAAGDITATQIQSLTNLDENDIALTSTHGGSIDAAMIDAGSEGDVILMSAGKIEVDNLTANRLSATSQDSMTLSTSVDEITAKVTSTGNIEIQETDDLILANVEANDGAISVTAGKSITVMYVESKTDAVDNDIHIASISDIIFIDLIKVGRNNGWIYLNAENASVREVDTYDSDADIVAYGAYIKVLEAIGSLTDPNLNLEFDVSRLNIDAYDMIVNLVGDIT
ncbi:MAG: translocation/assembly module TamB, partial [Bacteroidales bacterium]|nr:translocation/assembly module TamB [Bacteroidales bacterium]